MKYDDMLRQSNAAGSSKLKQSLAIVALLPLAIFLFVGTILYFNLCVVPPHETRPFSSDPAAFEPFAMLIEAQDYAGSDAVLTGISIDLVRSDGTQDFANDYQPAPKTTYNFYRLTDRPESAPPSDAQYSQEIVIEAYKPSEDDYFCNPAKARIASYNNKGFTKEERSPSVYVSRDEELGPPQCGLADLWTRVLEQGVSDNALANVRYSVRGYEFFIQGGGMYRFDPECNLL